MRKFLALALGLAAVGPLATPASAQFSVGISVNFGPPPLPVYDQPPIPGPDYVWMPGFWAWDDDEEDYFWVPGTWVMAPRPGLLWTPPWWGWSDGVYLFHPGYWAPHVGFYGGVNYGFGYTGDGFEGAYWNGPHLFYNRSVTNITNVHITNVYNKTVIVNRVTNVSYSGGPGGVRARPTPMQLQALREPHIAPTPAQVQHIQVAHVTPQLFAGENRGRPPVAAAPRPGLIRGPGVVPARFALPYHPPQFSGRHDDGRTLVPPRADRDDPRLGRRYGGPPPQLGHVDHPSPYDEPASHGLRQLPEHSAPVRDGLDGGPPRHARAMTEPPVDRAPPPLRRPDWRPSGGPPPGYGRDAVEGRPPPPRPESYGGPPPGAAPHRPPPHAAPPRGEPHDDRKPRSRDPGAER